jgi:adenosine deaminase
MASPSWMNERFIRAIPKSDLHVHLDGSLRLSTLIDLAKSQKVKLPSSTEEGLNKLVFKKKYANLEEYLRGFALTCAVMRDPENLERIAYELAQDNFAEGVRYIEPRFGPQLHAHAKMGMEEVFGAVYRGLERAKKEINRGKAIVSGAEPPFDYALIGCSLRKFGPHFSPYFENFCHSHQYTPEEKIYPMASLELVRAMVDIRDRLGIPITGFDLAGEEKGYPANAHREAFFFAQNHFLKKTVHAGEAYGPPSIFQAITKCYANRIGHGTYLFATELVDVTSPSQKEKYVKNLAEYISSSRITVEVCLTSNLQTIPSIQRPQDHPLGRMIAEKLSLTICTDNRLVSHTSVCEEILKIIHNFTLNPEDLKNMIVYGFKRSFSSMPYPEKRLYVRQVINYYEKIEREFQNHGSAKS